MRAVILLVAAIVLAFWAPTTFVAVSPAQAAQPLQISLDQSDKRFGKYYVKTLASLLYRPQTTAPAPTIVFMHGCGGIGGLSMTSAESYGQHFATLGYATLILDINDDRHLKDMPCSNRAMSFGLLPVRGADLDAAVKWLVASNISLPEKIVSLGTSHGGETTIEHDQQGHGSTKLAGEIAFYPGCDRGTPYARSPLLILIGEKDMSDGPRRSLALTCSDYATAANRAGGAHVEAVTYPGAGHAFDVAGMGPGTSQSLNPTVSGYQEAAAKASLAKIDAFLAQVFR